MVRDCKTIVELEQLIQTSTSKPVFLLKHSSRCPISAMIIGTFTNFAEKETRAEFWRVWVLENRPISNAISEKSGIAHESPQVLLFYGGKPVWHESHWGISEASLSGALKATVKEA